MARCRWFEEDFGLLLRFMTTHLFQFRFAETEQYWMITLTFFRTCDIHIITSVLFVRCFLDVEQLQTHHIRQFLVTFQRCRVTNIRIQRL